ncbi:MAG: hypothetical protein PHU21_07455 [Elusimicrobia bacterium]|nr:hypothetical protein [Elusimicrobiota bacterium]
MKGKKTGGREKGTPNRMTGAHQDLIDAWDKVSGPQTAKKIMKAAIEAAIGDEIIIESADGTKLTKKPVRNFEPLKALLPFIARKMPERTEIGRMTLEDLICKSAGEDEI